MNKTNMANAAKTGTVEDVTNLLISYGKKKWATYNDNECSRMRIGNRCLDTICSAAASDEDADRRAAKKTIIAAYTAHGKKAFEKKTAERPELETLRQLAFNSASEKVVGLLKAQANDEAAVRAIIAGAQQDHKHRFRRETKEDKERRADKKDILAEYFAKSGRFAPAETIAVQLPVTPAKPAALRMQ